MNLTKLFEAQKVLDERIIKDKGLEGKDLLPGKILALQVELGELANEWRGFKFWSNNQKPCITGHKGRCERCEGTGYIGTQYNPCDAGCFKGFALFSPLLEEYVDCLHFILSIGLEKKWTPVGVDLTLRADTVTNQFLGLLSKIGDFSRYKTQGNYYRILELFVGLGEMLGFTWEKIEQAYFEKNKVNHQRQEANY